MDKHVVTAPHILSAYPFLHLHVFSTFAFQKS